MACSLPSYGPTTARWSVFNAVAADRAAVAGFSTFGVAQAVRRLNRAFGLVGVGGR
jgi:hypothetical protein